MPSKPFVLALFATTCLATPYPNETAPYTWTVQKFNGTCSAATCWAWGFSISGAVGPSGQPAFKASDCSIDSRIDDHQQCKNMELGASGSVAVQIGSAGIDGGLLNIQYMYQQGSIRYTYYGNHSVTRRVDGIQPDFLQPNEFVVVSNAASAVGLQQSD